MRGLYCYCFRRAGARRRPLLLFPFWCPDPELGPWGTIRKCERSMPRFGMRRDAAVYVVPLLRFFAVRFALNREIFSLVLPSVFSRCHLSIVNT